MNAPAFIDALGKEGISFFCGVPDSLLKSFCAALSDKLAPSQNVITANEGNAVGLACGHYLASGNPALVYMQNSGLGNCVNPILSLADKDVYSIPFLMLIGWRGEPNRKDEPQHIAQGRVSGDLLKAMGIEFAVLPESEEDILKALKTAVETMREKSAPYALIVRSGTFDEYKRKSCEENRLQLPRELAIGIVAKALPQNAVTVSTTGHISRELYEFRSAQNQGHKKDFLTVGSMGHASSIAMGIAMQKPDKPVFCFDGDGAFIMHMGSSAVIASRKLGNFRHIVFNNGAHDSVGGQPTVALDMDMAGIAKAVGYATVASVETQNELVAELPRFLTAPAPALLEIKVKRGARKDLGRPKEKPVENKRAFMEFLKEC